MSYLEELLPEFRKGAKIRMNFWPKEEYICLKDCDIVDKDGCCRYDELNHISNWFLNGNWEIYQEPIDWQYIIDHNCLCWFWNNPQNDNIFMGKLKKFFLDEMMSSFTDHRNIRWDYCCPVRRDEVTFYEDKEDD